MSDGLKPCSVFFSLVISWSLCFVVAHSAHISPLQDRMWVGGRLWMCYEVLIRETDSLTSVPQTPVLMLHTFPFIRDTVENVEWLCGRGGMWLARLIISSCLSTFQEMLRFSILLLCLTEYLQNSVIISESNQMKAFIFFHTTKNGSLCVG